MSINFSALGGLFTFRYINDVEDMDEEVLQEMYAELDDEYQGMKNDCKELKKELDKLKEVIDKKDQKKWGKLTIPTEGSTGYFHVEDAKYDEPELEPTTFKVGENEFESID